MWETRGRSRALIQLNMGDREGAQRQTGTWAAIHTPHSWYSSAWKQTHALVATRGKGSACSCLGGQALGTALKEGARKGDAGERDVWEQDRRADRSSCRYRCLPHAPAGGALGRGNVKMCARAHVQTAFKEFPQGVGQSGNSFQKRDIKPKRNLVTLHQSCEVHGTIV